MGAISSYLILFLLLALRTASGAPVPIPKESENAVEEEEGLLVLVPTVPVDGKGKPTKREIDYELISIPGELIRKTVKEVTASYGTRGGPKASPSLGLTGPASIYVSNLSDNDDNEIILSAEEDLKVAQSQSATQKTSSPDNNEFLSSFDDDAAIKISPTTYEGSIRGKETTVSKEELSLILSSLATSSLSAASTGVNFAGQAKSALSTAKKVGTNAVVGGTQAVKWALQQKASGIRSFAEFAGTGLNYAGRLTSAILKVLLRIPRIKAKVVSDLIQAGQPLASSISDVITESADNIGDIFAAQSDIFRDAVNILFKLIQNVLALQGRILASFSAGGLDKGASIVTSGVKVGSALVQTAGDVASSVGRGVGELVKVVSEANLPSPPALPTITFPVLPKITYPTSSEENKYGPPPKETYKAAPVEIYASTGEGSFKIST